MGSVVSCLTDFAFNSVLLLISGCLSLVIIGLLFSGGVFLSVTALGSFDKKLKKRSQIPDRKCNTCSRRLQDILKDRELICKKCDVVHCYRCSYEEICVNCLPEDSKYRKIPRNLKEELLGTADKVASSVPKRNSVCHRDVEVRQFMEQLVETLLGGSIDSTSSTNVPNLPCASYQTELSNLLSRLSRSLHAAIDDEDKIGDNEAPSSVYLELKYLIMQISKDARVSSSFVTSRKDSVKRELPQGKLSYEDILASTILKKIVADHMDEMDYKLSPNKNILYSETDFLTRDLQSIMVKEETEEITTEYITSDYNGITPTPITKFLSNANFISSGRTHFPEFGKDILDGTDVCTDDEDDIDIENCETEVISAVDSWEDNWLFQKKKPDKYLRNLKAHCTESVPMLVPNPCEDYKTLIGDVEADQMSDLSECSDSVLEELIEPSSYRYSRKAVYENLIPDRLTSRAKSVESLSSSSPSATIKSLDRFTDQESSGITSISRDMSEFYTSSRSISPSEGSTNCCHLDVLKECELTQEDSGEGSLEGQQDNEYSVHSESSGVEMHVESTICDKRPSIGENSVENEKFETYDSSPTDYSSSPPKPGTIAEREHLKWQHAIPLNNNPYSKENLEKRMTNMFIGGAYSSNKTTPIDDEDPRSNYQNGVEEILVSTKPDYKTYSRDYYVKGVNNADQKMAQKDENREMQTKVQSEDVKKTEEPENQPSQNVIIQEVEYTKEREDFSTKKLQCVDRKDETTGGEDLLKEVPEPEENKVPASVGETIGSVFSSTDRTLSRAERVANATDRTGKNLVRVSSWADRKQKDSQKHGHPNVKELAKQFDENKKDSKSTQRSSKQVHSLTARSMSREFREGLRNNAGHIFNRNVSLESNKRIEENDSADEGVSDDLSVSEKSKFTQSLNH